MMGLVNITTGLVYQHPMPVQPMKVLAVVAIAQRWSPSMVYASGFAMGVIWLLFAVTNTTGWVARVIPDGLKDLGERLPYSVKNVGSKVAKFDS